LLNIAHQHLRSRLEHGRDCGAEGCAGGCRFLWLERWLNSPVLSREIERDRLIEQRIRELPIKVRE